MKNFDVLVPQLDILLPATPKLIPYIEQYALRSGRRVRNPSLMPVCRLAPYVGTLTPRLGEMKKDMPWLLEQLPVLAPHMAILAPSTQFFFS
jgi:hypothetical protein